MYPEHESDEARHPSEHVPSEEKSFLASDKSTLPKRRRSALDAIGPLQLVTLVTSSISLFGSVIFLSALWKTSISVSSGQGAPELWQTLVDRKWIVRAVTISSVVIRISVAVQVGLVTPMIASLLLERAGTRVGGLPMLSVMRSVTSSPHQLIGNSLHQLRRKTSLPFLCLALVALLTSTVLQFASTILLSDFGDQSLQGRAISTNVTFGLNRLNMRSSLILDLNNTDDRAGAIDPYSGVNYWKSSPSTYPRFAEWHQPAGAEEGVADTGLTYRAFLPFSSSDTRRSLRNFTGVATVLDFRTVCVRPNLTIQGAWLVNDDLLALDGFAEWEIEYSMLSHWPKPVPRTNLTSGFITKTFFNCTVPLDSSRIRSMGFWRITLCRTSDATYLKAPQGGLKSLPFLTNSYILINSTGSEEQWIDAGDFTDWKASSNGSWTSLSAERLDSNPSSFSATMCFINPSPSNYDVNIWATTDGIEPSLTWDPTTRQFNTDAVRRLYDSLDPQSTREQRGILTLDNHANWTAQLADPKLNVSTLDFVWAATLRGFETNNADYPTDGGGALLTPWSDRVAQGIHRAHIALFQHVIRSTHNPALALQTLFTVVTQSAYYDFLPQFDVEAPGLYTVSAVANIPYQGTGLTIVVAILAIHALVVGATTTLFLVGTNVSMLGNAWQAVAQVVRLVDRDILEDASLMRDKNVLGILKSSGRAGKVVKVS
ncbi:hypothetical protein IQ07DRAFT_681579 [Pyrenochaeta sp. DS3sAY3a]|nr:hypothetical protein IQ07DRAFT_681579 [Pyrenochaeta sp. DS3sAY3a]